MTAPLSSYAGMPVVVAGAGVSGAAAARALRDLGAQVTVAEASEERGAGLAAEGFAVRALDAPPGGTALVVTSPGWRPSSPLLTAAAAAGTEVIGEVELAWRLAHAPDAARPAAPWLALTGTNGKTTTVRMLASILAAAGRRTVATGNVGLPIVEAVLDVDPETGEGYDVLAVELSSFQLHWSSSLRPQAAALLNLADDHTDWHGSFQEYVHAKAKVWSSEITIGNAEDEVVKTLLNRCTGYRVGFTVGPPRAAELGLVETLLVDRAFTDGGGRSDPKQATELADLSDLAVPGAHNVANALAAAALARAHGVPAEAVRDGLRAFRPDPHRNALVAVVDDVAWVDDSKATNPHAAAASLAAYDAVVWCAGGLLKGAQVDDLVRSAAGSLRAVVLLGTDRAAFADALRRHAPEVPVVEVERLDTGAMSEVVAAARSLARPGDTVLLAPAAASMDCFRDYAERGDLFARAVTGA